MFKQLPKEAYDMEAIEASSTENPQTGFAWYKLSIEGHKDIYCHGMKEVRREDNLDLWVQLTVTEDEKQVQYNIKLPNVNLTHWIAMPKKAEPIPVEEPAK